MLFPLLALVARELRLKLSAPLPKYSSVWVS